MKKVFVPISVFWNNCLGFYPIFLAGYLFFLWIFIFRVYSRKKFLVWLCRSTVKKSFGVNFWGWPILFCLMGVYVCAAKLQPKFSNVKIRRDGYEKSFAKKSRECCRISITCNQSFPKSVGFGRAPIGERLFVDCYLSYLVQQICFLEFATSDFFRKG